MDPIISLTTTSVLGQLPSSGFEGNAVAPADQARFERALDAEPSNDAANATESISETGTEVSSAKPNVTSESLGDALIEGIQQIKTSYDSRAERIQARLNVLADNPLSLQDAMSMQFELMQINMQQELTSKMADKTSQGVQTLFRNQG